MPSIKYLGPTENDIDVLDRLRLQTEISGDLTPAMVDQRITTALTSKADSFYLGSKSSEYAAPSSMSGRGTNLINKVTQVNGPGEPVTMSGGRIPAFYLPNSNTRPGGKRYAVLHELNFNNFQILHGFWNSTNERDIGVFTVPGPDYPWFPVFVGDFFMTQGKGEVCVKQGSRYIARAVSGNIPHVWWTCSVAPMDSLTSYTGSVRFTITQRAFHGGTELGSGYRLTCLCVPA